MSVIQQKREYGQHRGVDGEGDERAALEEGEEEADGDRPREKRRRDPDGHGERIGGERGARGGEGDAFVEGGGDYDGDGEQEGKARRFRLFDAREPEGGYGRAAPRQSRQDGDALHRAGG